ncbi:MAG: S-adenosylmethionine:tRNA ribosyltransferase-isomerase, partial [Alistipes sp.]|nr:S-adenosylmethionine:tRNA ribosyltransferase-isomerase [Alistipes sp.]
MERHIDINQYDYPLTDDRIAKFPLDDRASSKLLVYRHGEITQSTFGNIGDLLPDGATLIFNNTRVVRARLIMHKSSGARIEIFCLEPHSPADYERAFAVKGCAEWSCIVGNLKKWKEGEVGIDFTVDGRDCRLAARIV